MQISKTKIFLLCLNIEIDCVNATSDNRSGMLGRGGGVATCNVTAD